MIASMLACRVSAAEDGPNPVLVGAGSGARHADIVAPLTIVVDTTPDSSDTLLKAMFAETAAIWNPANLEIRWHLGDPESVPADRRSVRVAFQARNGGALGAQQALGWITFSATGAPQPVISLSRDNATWLLDATGTYTSRPTRERDMLLGRALGRALAHELGHYLLASKNHTSVGLMRGVHFNDEFFSPSRAGFQLSRQEQAMLAARVGWQPPS